ncbi:50S ribosomal protein L13 [Acetohalobium arabaticum]|uniref:Large ribosomal subunit protein uL13 n=1 Tax=Acetohalobium arabaticum (strain ATCC 49924 / DSM 5501 / Z-7288) TaxID=574087 RepID=D9QTI2_ACEAZ|nr:50S ribosomal protein L13 [Acetohalobium arabaticum]ADL11746.1 LSU ribosomal protein L13P [Acetohalobium arabaticum DSM 5501]
MTTYMAKPEEIERDWFVVDAAGERLGRLASKIANVLRGKHKPTYTPHVDTGDYVIVVNAGEVVLTGNKLDQKMHHTHSEYPGGLKSTSYRELLEEKPEKVIELAVKGMVPKNKLGRKMMKKLKIYAASEHPHEAQQPEELEI